MPRPRRWLWRVAARRGGPVRVWRGQRRPGRGLAPHGLAGGRPLAERRRPWQGRVNRPAAHQVCSSAAFLALVVACFMLARRYRASRQRRTAACSLAAGVLCAAGVASGGAPHGSLTLFAGVSIALLWVAVVSAQLSTAASLAPAQ
jgi:hypothetical protein